MKDITELTLTEILNEAKAIEEKIYKSFDWDYFINSSSSSGNKSIQSALEELQKDIHTTALEKGWWEKERNTGEAICLMHSELSEALEADRHGNPPDDKIPEFSGIEAELADCLIRILDFAAGRDFDVIGAVLRKVEYNKGREYKHGKSY